MSFLRKKGKIAGEIKKGLMAVGADGAHTKRFRGRTRGMICGAGAGAGAGGVVIAADGK